MAENFYTEILFQRITTGLKTGVDVLNYANALSALSSDSDYKSQTKLLGLFPCGHPNGTYNASALACCLRLNEEWFQNKWGEDPNYGGILHECASLEQGLKECKETCLGWLDSQECQECCLNSCETNRSNEFPSLSTCASKQREKELDQENLRNLNAQCEYYYGKQNKYRDPKGRPTDRVNDPYYRLRRWFPEDFAPWREAPTWNLY